MLWLVPPLLVLLPGGGGSLPVPAELLLAESGALLLLGRTAGTTGSSNVRDGSAASTSFL